MEHGNRLVQFILCYNFMSDQILVIIDHKRYKKMCMQKKCLPQLPAKIIVTDFREQTTHTDS